jgi:thiazole/oxazole-forming peptide maturase SagD family component
MKSFVSQLFNSPGYLKVSEYLDDIYSMKKYGPWRLPLGYGDRLHLLLLGFFARFSWFSSRLFIEHRDLVSPSYALLLSYLKKMDMFDFLVEKDLHYRGYYAFHLKKEVHINSRSILVMGQGVAKDRATAVSIAIGEMIERMVTGVYDTTPPIEKLKTVEEIRIKGNFLYPPKFHRVFEKQKARYKELRTTSSSRINWTLGKNLVTHEDTYIPYQMTSWFKERSNLKEIFVHATTNGSAGFFDRDTPVLRGILEVVQRDGFLVHWLTQIPPQRIVHTSLPEHFQEQIKEFECLGIRLYILNVTSLSIPSIFIVAINEKAEVQQVVLSGGASLSFEEAIASALKEMVIGMEMFYYGKNFEDLDGVDKDVAPFTSNLDKLARQLYWRGNEQVKKIKWFISGEDISFEEISKNNLSQGRTSREKIDICLDVLQKYGEEYYPVVYYPKNKIQETLGFYVAQVFIPKAFPFYLFEGYGTFDSDRLQDFAQGKGVKDWTLNPEPHMFS